jgi:hypothetical protein
LNFVTVEFGDHNVENNSLGLCSSVNRHAV